MYTFLSTALLATLASLLSTSAAAPQAAIIVVEASHGGAGQDLTNTTITVPLTAAYTNSSVLDEVSTLYLTGATGVPVSSITCQPFTNSNGTGYEGPSFNSSEPRYLSTNTVQIGSIVCVSSSISFAPPSGPPGGPEPLSSSSASASSNLTRTMTKPGAATSTLVKTTHAGGAPVTQSTVTSVVSGEPSSGASATMGGAPSSTSSGAPSLSTGNSNAANGLSLGSEFFGGLALFGFGLAFVL